MYKKGEYVIYGSSGVCQIGDITTLNFDNVPKNRKYYVLYPALHLQKDRVLEYIIKEIDEHNKE